MSNLPFMFLPFVLLGVIILNILLARSGKHFKKTDDFIEEEIKANSARRKEIPPNLYVKPDKNILPVRDYTENDSSHLEQTRKYVAAYLDRTMIRLPKPMTNNEIKYEFGVANLDNVIEYEDNYNKYIEGLIRLAGLSLDSGYTDDAKNCLKESIRLMSDHSKSYTMLYDIYSDEKNTRGIKELKELVSKENFFNHNPAVRSRIKKYIL